MTVYYDLISIQVSGNIGVNKMEEVCAYIRWAYILLGEVNNKKYQKKSYSLRKELLEELLKAIEKPILEGQSQKASLIQNASLLTEEGVFG